MVKPEPLPADALHRRCELAELRFETTDELSDLDEVLGQARAMEALRFGTGMRHSGYNLYVLGPPGLGKHTVVRGVLGERAGAAAAPLDACYVNNFNETNKPRLLRLPPGRARRLRADMRRLVEDLLAVLPAAFAGEEYQRRRKQIAQQHEERQEQAIGDLQERAEAEHIALLRTPAGFAFAPMRDGEVLGPKEFNQLADAERARVEAPVKALQEQLQGVLQEFPRWRKEAREAVKRLNRETAENAVSHELEELRAPYADAPEVRAYLDEVGRDVLDNFDDFLAQERDPDAVDGGLGPDSPEFRRYQVNLLVDHADSEGAPVIYENNPLYDNLLGRVEHITQMGTLATDFMLIRPGALHRANGGYLMLDAHKVLGNPFAWEALKRTLFAREICIESLARALGLISTVSLEPEPMPLDVKVVLIGDRLLYYLLHEYDPEFGELFKVAADFEERIERDAASTELYARLIATQARRHALMPFRRDAVARLIEHGSRLVEDAEKLTTRLASIGDLMREADYWAGQRGADAVAAQDVEQAVAHQIYRADRISEQIQEEMRRGTLMVDTAGEALAQVNGLTVMELGRFLFGHPVRITATARMGEGEVVDIEREVELGGAIHSKGVLILSRLLAARYALDRPLSLSASLVFEQSYGFVEGDSASVAELCALLSALADVPIRQSLAVTGSVNQHGEVQPIGGVNEKIEGFFDLCAARGLSGDQGVLVPAANRAHLMLRRDVVEAVAAGRFHVWAVAKVDEAMELLTGRAAGARDADGHFPEDSINARIEQRLVDMADARHAFGEHGKGPDELEDKDGEHDEERHD